MRFVVHGSPIANPKERAADSNQNRHVAAVDLVVAIFHGDLRAIEKTYAETLPCLIQVK
jgi:hypothetical protein